MLELNTDHLRFFMTYAIRVPHVSRPGGTNPFPIHLYLWQNHALAFLRYYEMEAVAFAFMLLQHYPLISSLSCTTML